MHPGLLLSGYNFLFQPDLYALLYLSLTPVEWNYSHSPFSAMALYFLSFVPLAPAVRNSRHSYSTHPSRWSCSTTSQQPPTAFLSSGAAAQSPSSADSAAPRTAARQDSRFLPQKGVCALVNSELSQNPPQCLMRRH